MKRIGIDVGGSHIGTGLVENGTILFQKEKDLSEKDRDNIREVLIDTIVGDIKEILKENNLKPGEIERIGIAIPGGVANNKIIYAMNLNLDGLEIIDKLKQHIQIPIVMKNDAKCAAIAEKTRGAMKDYKDCLFLCLGTGVGGAVYIKGELLEAKRMSGFELGHMVIDPTGERCGCGRNGCFETFCSMKRLKKKIVTTFKLNQTLSGEEVQQYIRSNLENPTLTQILEEFLDYLTIGISNLIYIFEPEIICIGGSFVYYEDLLLDKLQSKINTMNQRNKDIIIKTAKFKNNAGIIGASEI